ncbi:MAG: long-chain-fatty-acid--CoA ligase [Syntrophales bacterium]|nr:long-chain-fatty-acid--CoA ligase [Syntrophales bacterium]
MAGTDLGFKLKENGDKFPAKPAVIFQDKKTSYRVLNNRAARFANAMISLGLKSRDKVSVISRNSTEYVEIICGLVKAGLVHVPINWRLSSEEMDYVINNSDSVAVVLTREFLEKLIPIQKRLKNVPAGNYILIDGLAEGMKNYEEMLASAPDTEPSVENGEFAPYFIGYTSGTTGKPKGAVTRHANWEVKAKGVEMLMGIQPTPDEVQLLTMPLFHMNAINSTGASLYLGQTVVIMTRFDAEEALRLIQTYKCTFSSMVPTMYHRLKNLPEEIKNRYDTSSVKSLLQSSAPLPFSTKKWLVEFFKSAGLYEAYGGTEAGGATVLLPQEQLARPGSVGRPLPTTEVKIVDEDGKELPIGQVGQIISRSRSVDGPIPAVTEYYRDPEATIKNFKDGWFYSGDMGYFNEEGYLYLVDRKFDMIISGGENIYPKEIEDVLYAHPSIADVAVVGIPDEEWGEAVKAVVTLKEGATATEKELIEICKGCLGKYKTPKSVDFVDDLPKTETGKILRRVVKEPYWKGREKRI